MWVMVRGGEGRKVAIASLSAAPFPPPPPLNKICREKCPTGSELLGISGERGREEAHFYDETNARPERETVWQKWKLHRAAAFSLSFAIPSPLDRTFLYDAELRG